MVYYSLKENPYPYQYQLNKYRRPKGTIFVVLFINAFVLALVFLCELSNEWITVKNTPENITYCSGHYFGCVLHNKNRTYVCSPHIMYMRQSTFTHGVGHHLPEWFIKRIRRFHYFVNYFKFQKSTTHYNQTHNYIYPHRDTNKNRTNINRKYTNIKTQLEQVVMLTIPISHTISYLFLDNDLFDKHINVTDLLNNLTIQYKPNYNQINHSIEYNPDIRNQDDLLLISELLMINNSLKIVPINEVYYHFTDYDTSSTLLSIKLSFLMCCILIITSLPLYIGIISCITIKTFICLAIILGYQTIIGFTFLAPFTVFIVNILYDKEYYNGETPLEIGFGKSVYIATANISILVISIIFVLISVGCTIRYHRSFKYVQLVLD